MKLQNTFYTKDKIISLGFSVYTALWPAHLLLGHKESQVMMRPGLETGMDFRGQFWKWV